jgi:hypothetical protein
MLIGHYEISYYVMRAWSADYVCSGKDFAVVIKSGSFGGWRSTYIVVKVVV